MLLLSFLSTGILKFILLCEIFTKRKAELTREERHGIIQHVKTRCVQVFYEQKRHETHEGWVCDTCNYTCQSWYESSIQSYQQYMNIGSVNPWTFFLLGMCTMHVYKQAFLDTAVCHVLYPKYHGYQRDVVDVAISRSMIVEKGSTDLVSTIGVSLWGEACSPRKGWKHWDKMVHFGAFWPSKGIY